MTKNDRKKIIRQRTRPSLFDFCYITTRGHLKAFLVFKEYLKKENKPLHIIDIGCGYKPFKSLLREIDIAEYLGVDFDTNRSAADIVAPIDKLPLEDNTFDAVIASEVLEHTPELEKAIQEIRRVTKNGALVYISTPFLLGEHGVPFDFQRITRYRYLNLFKNDEVVFLKGTNKSLATPYFIWNVMLENIAIFKLIPVIPEILYFVNNVQALIGEICVGIINFTGSRIFRKRKDWFTKLMQIYFDTMPGGFDVIVRINK